MSHEGFAEQLMGTESDAERERLHDRFFGPNGELDIEAILEESAKGAREHEPTQEEVDRLLARLRQQEVRERIITMANQDLADAIEHPEALLELGDDLELTHAQTGAVDKDDTKGDHRG